MRSIADQLPHESLIYIGDTKNGPYGPLSLAEVRNHALAIADELVERGCKMIVIACNTASAACLRDARERYDIPIVEVIVPAVRRAVTTTRNSRVGVIGTRGTIRSEAYQDLFTAVPDIKITAVPCPKFVDFIEQGITSGPEIQKVAEGYFKNLIKAEIDTLVLGCTHYPLITGLIQLTIGEHVTLVSSAEETAKDVVRLLTEAGMLSKGPISPRYQYTFEATGNDRSFSSLVSRFLGPIYRINF